MKRVLTILSVLAFSAFFIFAQQEGDYGGDLSGDFGGGYYSEPPDDTTFILNWTFGTGMPSGVTEAGNVSIDSSFDTTYLGEDFDTNSLAGWTEVGGVDLIVHPTNGVVTDSVLEITVSGGESDNIQKTFSAVNECWKFFSFRFTSADTVDWNDDEYIFISVLENASSANGIALLTVVRLSGVMKWRLFYRADDLGPDWAVSSDTLVADTWYNLILHVKRASAAGANDGVFDLTVDGVDEIISVTDWDNDEITYDRTEEGNWASELDAIYYIDNVLLQGEPNPCLEVTKETGGDDYISISVGDESEYWFDLDYTLKPWYSGWADTEKWRIIEVAGNSSGRVIISVIDDSGTKKWQVWYEHDTGNATVNLSTGPTDNTKHNLGFYSKRATAVGADDGYMQFWVDGDSLWAVADVDNDAGGINAVILGDKGSGVSLVATVHIDNVKFWARSGLP